MTDEQAERIAATLERIEKQNQTMMTMLAVLANAAPQHSGAGQMTYYFNPGPIPTGQPGSR
jgi:hypothetical protein